MVRHRIIPRAPVRDDTAFQAVYDEGGSQRGGQPPTPVRRKNNDTDLRAATAYGIRTDFPGHFITVHHLVPEAFIEEFPGLYKSFVSPWMVKPFGMLLLRYDQVMMPDMIAVG